MRFGLPFPTPLVVRPHGTGSKPPLPLSWFRRNPQRAQQTILMSTEISVLIIPTHKAPNHNTVKQTPPPPPHPFACDGFRSGLFLNFFAASPHANLNSSGSPKDISISYFPVFKSFKLFNNLFKNKSLSEKSFPPGTEWVFVPSAHSSYPPLQISIA